MDKVIKNIEARLSLMAATTEDANHVIRLLDQAFGKGKHTESETVWYSDHVSARLALRGDEPDQKLCLAISFTGPDGEALADFDTFIAVDLSDFQKKLQTNVKAALKAVVEHKIDVTHHLRALDSIAQTLHKLI